MKSICFIVDGMLGNLARKLRMFGFDTLYYNHTEDDKLIQIGMQQDRVLLTCDKMLFRRAINAGIRSVLLDGSDGLDDMVHVLKNCRIHSAEFLPDKARCSLCNGTLDTRNKTSIAKLIPEQLINKHERFYFCQQCNKVYWEGSHMKKLQEFAMQVESRLNNAS